MAKNGASAPVHLCGAGGGLILKLRDVERAQRCPATNADVWQAEGGPSALYTEETPICAVCWMAYIAPIDKWSRSLGDPARFRVPLAPAIREFPVPRQRLSTSTVVYNQLYGAHQYTESVGYWCERDDAGVRDLQRYASAHGLSLDLEPGPPGKQNQVLVTATHTRRA